MLELRFLSFYIYFTCLGYFLTVWVHYDIKSVIRIALVVTLPCCYVRELFYISLYNDKYMGIELLRFFCPLPSTLYYRLPITTLPFASHSTFPLVSHSTLPITDYSVPPCQSCYNPLHLAFYYTFNLLPTSLYISPYQTLFMTPCLPNTLHDPLPTKHSS